jgi:hypothetical protein
VILADTTPTVLDWLSTVGETVGAVGTVAAVVVALWIANRDGRQRRAERADRDAGQARLISAELRREDGRWWVRTTNHSIAPIFDCEVLEVRHAGGPSRLEPVPGAPVVLHRLAPNQTVDRAVAADGDLSDATVVLSFLDAAGLRWHREGVAAPRRIVDP